MHTILIVCLEVFSTYIGVGVATLGYALLTLGDPPFASKTEIAQISFVCVFFWPIALPAMLTARKGRF
jgi:hypothetical protein